MKVVVSQSLKKRLEDQGIHGLNEGDIIDVDMGRGEALGYVGEQNIGSALGGGLGVLGAGALAATLGLPFWPALGLALVLGGAGSYLGGKTQKAIQGEEDYKKLSTTAEIAKELYPTSTKALELSEAAVASGFKPSIRVPLYAAKGLGELATKGVITTVPYRQALANAAASSVGQAAIGTGIDLLQKKTPSAEDILLGYALPGLAFSSPSSLGVKLGKFPDVPKVTPLNRAAGITYDIPHDIPGVEPLAEGNKWFRLPDSAVKNAWKKTFPDEKKLPPIEKMRIDLAELSGVPNVDLFFNIRTSTPIENYKNLGFSSGNPTYREIMESALQAEKVGDTEKLKELSKYIDVDFLRPHYTRFVSLTPEEAKAASRLGIDKIGIARKIKTPSDEEAVGAAVTDFSKEDAISNLVILSSTAEKLPDTVFHELAHTTISKMKFSQSPYLRSLAERIEQVGPETIATEAGKLWLEKLGKETLGDKFDFIKAAVATKFGSKDPETLAMNLVALAKNNVSPSVSILNTVNIEVAKKFAATFAASPGAKEVANMAARNNATTIAPINKERLIVGAKHSVGELDKELFQNAVDNGGRNIVVVQNDDKDLFLMKDDGTGMSPRDIVEKLLPLASSGKEGDTKKIGGFGYAKLSIMLDTKVTKYVTVKDGVRTTVVIDEPSYLNYLENADKIDVSDIVASKPGNYDLAGIKIKIEKTDEPNGTMAVIDLTSSTKEKRDLVNFTQVALYSGFKDFPVNIDYHFGNVTSDVRNKLLSAQSFSDVSKILRNSFLRRSKFNLSENFPEEFLVHSSPDFDVYLGNIGSIKNPVNDFFPVSIKGLFAGKTIFLPDSGFSARVNIIPKVLPTDPKYPTELNRKNLKASVEKLISDYLVELGDVFKNNSIGDYYKINELTIAAHSGLEDETKKAAIGFIENHYQDFKNLDEVFRNFYNTLVKDDALITTIAQSLEGSNPDNIRLLMRPYSGILVSPKLGGVHSSLSGVFIEPFASAKAGVMPIYEKFFPDVPAKVMSFASDIFATILHEFCHNFVSGESGISTLLTKIHFYSFKLFQNFIESGKLKNISEDFIDELSKFRIAAQENLSADILKSSIILKKLAETEKVSATRINNSTVYLDEDVFGVFFKILPKLGDTPLPSMSYLSLKDVDELAKGIPNILKDERYKELRASISSALTSKGQQSGGSGSNQKYSTAFQRAGGGSEPTSSPIRPTVSTNSRIVLPIFGSIVDRIEKLNSYVGSAFRSAYAFADFAEGKIANSIVAAGEGLTNDQITKVYKYLYEIDDAGKSAIQLSPEEQRFADEVVNILRWPRLEQIKYGLKVKEGSHFRQAGIRPDGYMFNMIDPEVANVWTKEPTSELAKVFDNLYINHLIKKGFSKEEAEDLLAAKKLALSGGITPVEFAALRKAEGAGLPWELIDKEFFRAAHRYARRAGKDLAYFKYLQNDEQVRNAIGISDQFGNKPKLTKDYIGGTDQVRQGLEFFNLVEEIFDRRTMAAARAASNLVMGVGTAGRNIANIPAFVTPYLKSDEFKMFFEAFAKLNETRVRAFTSNAVRQHFQDFDIAGFVPDNPDQIIKIFDTFTRLARFLQGRDFSDAFEGHYIYTIGELLAPVRIAEALQGDKTGLWFVQRFGDTVEGGWQALLERKVTEDDIQRMAKRFVDAVRGTYGPEGLPAWALKGGLAPFAALSRFSIEKANTVTRDIVEPLVKDGNVFPLLKYTLASLGVGYGISELNELLMNRRPNEPTIKEVMNEGNLQDHVAKTISLLQLASYSGIIFDIAKLVSVTAQGKTLKVNMPLSFPLWTVLTETIAGNISDAIEAINTGENPYTVIATMLGNMTKEASQTWRYIDAHFINEEEAKLREKYRDLAMFKFFRERKSPISDIEVNPYINLEAKKFIKEGKGPIPTSSTEVRLAYRTFPGNFIEGKMYYDYLVRNFGEEEAQKRWEDFLEKSFIYKVRRSLIEPRQPQLKSYR